MGAATQRVRRRPCSNGVKVLDGHSHIHDIPMTDRSQAPRLSYQFWHDLWYIQGLGAAKPLPSPIAPGKHSDRPGNRDEDFQAVAASLAKYLEARKIDAQIINPHPLQFHGWMEDIGPERHRALSERAGPLLHRDGLRRSVRVARPQRKGADAADARALLVPAVPAVPMFESDPALSFLSDEQKKDILHNTPARLAPGLADAAAQNAKAKVKAY